MSPQNPTEHQLSAIALPESDDRFDQELAAWFARHGGVWSGTAAELLAAIKTGLGVLGNDLLPRSPRVLYAHLESHGQTLGSLGVDVALHYGYPRMVSLRSCQDKQTAEPPRSRFGINETFGRDTPPAESNSAACSLSGKDAAGESPEGVCDHTEEKLLAMLRDSATDQLSDRSTVSKLTSAPTRLFLTVKRAWMRRARPQ
jgi:hypothetical protein